MNRERHTILALIATGRITPAQAERLLGTLNEARETAWILALCLGYAALVQLRLHDWVPGILHFFNTQIPAMAEVAHHALSTIADRLPLMQVGGLL
jgi:hypothetical protein